LPIRTSSVAVAMTSMLFPVHAPFGGDVTVTVGGVVSDPAVGQTRPPEDGPIFMTNASYVPPPKPG